MTLAPLEKVEKLNACDVIMFNLATAADKKQAILKVGKLLCELGLLEDATDQPAIIAAYQKNVQARLQNYLRETRKEKDDFVLNEKTLAHYETVKDQDIAEMAQTCHEDFIEYSCIVLTFTERGNALKLTKKDEEYREEFGRVDKKRSQVHDSCLELIAPINRLAEKDGIEPFVTTNLADPNRTDYGAAIIKLCYRQMNQELNALK